MPEQQDRHPIVARFAHNLRAARQRAGLSQEDFARKAGIDRSYYSGLERGVRNPTITVLAELAEHLGVEPMTLLAPS